MIHKLSFSNFFSFKDKVTVDFVVDKNSPDTDAYFTDNYGNRISKIMTVVGANASGKTNLLKSLAFLKWFITESFSGLKPEDPISQGFKPFAFCKEINISAFELVFAIGGDIYAYNLELTANHVVKESLDIKNKETNRWNDIFSRSLVGGKNSYEANYAKLEVSSDFEKIVRGNSSVLSAAKQINNKIAVKIVNYFSNVQTSTDGMAESMNKNIPQQILSAGEYFNNNPKIKEKAEKILHTFDLGLSRFSLQEIKPPEGPAWYVPIIYHKYSDIDKEGHLTIFDESGGTRNLFSLLKDILAALETGDIVVFDELDNNLHALMVPEIVNLFRSKTTNPKNAQLFFSTHNVQILNELDKSQIVIVEKNEKNISEAWKLSDIEGVRTDENYYVKYLSGMYGGIPKFN
jgi:uncharacterized protein